MAKKSKTAIKEAMKGANHEELKILIIGATGAGKSTFINLLYLLSRDVKAEDLKKGDKVLIKTSFLEGCCETEADVTKQGMSQTQFPKLYTFPIIVEKKKIVLHLLDTPGLGDTRGIDQDTENIDMIIDTVAKTEDLSAILFLINGGDARISTRLKYVISKLCALIPDEMQNNLFALLTNVGLMPNLNIHLLMDIEKSRVFWYDNNFFTISPEVLRTDEMTDTVVQQAFIKCVQIMSLLFLGITKCPVVKTKSFQKIKDVRQEMKKNISSFAETEAALHEKEKKISEILINLGHCHEDVMSLSTQLYKMEKKKHWVSVKTSTHNTNCLTCKKSCHLDCGLELIGIIGSALYKNCSIFSGNISCNQCGHNYESHLHEYEKYSEEMIDERILDTCVFEKVNESKTDADKKSALADGLELEKIKIKTNIVLLREKIINCAMELKKVCSKFDYLREIDASIGILKEQIEVLKVKLLGSTADGKKGEKKTLITDEIIQEKNALEETLKNLIDTKETILILKDKI